MQVDEDCVIVGPVGENDPVEELWQHCQPVQQDDGFGTQVQFDMRLLKKGILISLLALSKFLWLFFKRAYSFHFILKKY